MPIKSFASNSSIAAKEEVSDVLGKSEIFEASISELLKMLENKTITSEKLCEVYLERIDLYDKKGASLNSIVSLNTNALLIAHQRDLERGAGKLRGSLHGIPILVKDNINVSGFPTTLGRESLTDKIMSEDAAAVAALVKEGAIILGKTNLSTDDVATRYTVSSLIGETRNAYNTSFSSGGSSGGSAVAVSCNFAAAALSTDTNSSARYPGALNGVVTLRPTHSLVDYTGCENVVKARDVVAPVARSVKDCALLLDALTGNSKTATYSNSLSNKALSGKTIAVVKELSQYTYNSPPEWQKSDKKITALFESAIDKMREQGATIVTVSIPKLFTYYNTCRESSSTSASAKADLLAEVKNLLSKNGAALVYPSYLSSPMKSGFNEYGGHNSENANYLNCGSYLPSLIALPSICVPMGMYDDSVSTGLEFVSLANTEKELLGLAYSYEQASKNRIVPKTAPNLYKKTSGAISSQTDNTSKTPVSSNSQNNFENADSKAKSSNWQIITLVLIIGAILGLCVWVLIFSYKSDRRRTTHKNRRF